MTLPALKGGVSSLDRKLLILRGFIPRQLGGDKKFALKGGVLHPRIPINIESPVALRTPILDNKLKITDILINTYYSFTNLLLHNDKFE
jgi:hypothetical protein